MAQESQSQFSGLTLWRPMPLPAGSDLSCDRCDAPGCCLVDGSVLCFNHLPVPCPSCGRFVQMGMWPTCRNNPDDHGWAIASNAQRFDPVVIHFNPKTNDYRFPGSTDAKVPAGFMKQELRTSHEVRKFESRFNAQESAKIGQSVAMRHYQTQMRQRDRRAALRQQMQHMSPFGRDFARVAMEQNDNKRPRSFDPNFHIEAFSFDRSNRDAQVDRSTGWKARRG